MYASTSSEKSTHYPIHLMVFFIILFENQGFDVFTKIECKFILNPPRFMLCSNKKLFNTIINTKFYYTNTYPHNKLYTCLGKEMATVADLILQNPIMSSNDYLWTEYHVRCLDCFSSHSSSKENDTENIDILCTNGYCSNFYIQSNDRPKR